VTDPKRRLRPLDEVPTRDLWTRIEAHAAGPEPLEPSGDGTPLARRVATIAVAFAVFASGGAFLLARFDATEPGPPPSDDPVVDDGPAVHELRITCTGEGTIVEGDPVAIQADGVHVAIRNETAAELLYMRDPDDIERSVGMDLGGARSAATVLPMMEVGTWVAGCFRGTSFSTYDVPLSAYSPPVRIVDPDGFADDLRDAAVCGERLPDPVPSAGTEAPLAAPLAGRLTVHAWNHETGEGRAYFVDADGSDLEPIDVPPNRFAELELSPDGSRIALVIADSDGDPTVTYAALEDGEIYVMNRDGSSLTRLTDDDASDDLVHWTPDGRLSFRSNREGDHKLFVMAPDGSDVRTLVGLEVADRHDWDEGGRLAFIGGDGRDRGDGCRGRNSELHVMDADGSVSAITDDELFQQDPAWSPDGSTLAFIASNQSDYAWEIFLANADGSDVRRITEYAGYDHSPVWSPDGALIAFTSDRFRGPDLRGENQGGLPYVMNADGSGVQPLLTPADLGLEGDWEVFVTDWRA
jgi:hypothetical protein